LPSREKQILCRRGQPSLLSMLINGTAYAEELRVSLLEELSGLPAGAGIATLLISNNVGKPTCGATRL
jgi:hypothetical protein